MPAPRPSVEMGGYNPQTLPPSPEAVGVQNGLNTAPERPAAQETQTQGAQTPPILPVPTTSSVPATGARPILNPLTPQTDTPTVAADDEVIEKEWVDKAKKIVSQTKDNPYEQEKEVSKLQADYLKKRYGKDVKLASD